MLAVQTTDYRLARRHREAVRWDRSTERVSASGQFLATGTVAGHGQQRRHVDSEPHPVTQTPAVSGEFKIWHSVLRG